MKYKIIRSLLCDFLISAVGYQYLNNILAWDRFGEVLLAPNPLQVLAFAASMIPIFTLYHLIEFVVGAILSFNRAEPWEVTDDEDE